MESGKKQADSAAELDAEVTKLKQQEKEFEQTISQLQRDLDSLERENAKLKQAAPAEKNSKSMSIAWHFIESYGASPLTNTLQPTTWTLESLRHSRARLRRHISLSRSG